MLKTFNSEINSLTSFIDLLPMLLDKFLTYLQKEKNYSALTLKAYRADLSDFEIFLKAQNIDIEKANNKDIRSWIARLSGQNLSEKTINRKLAALKSFYKFLQKTGTVKQNPVAQVTGLRVRRKVPVPFSTVEIYDLLDAGFFPDDYEGIRDHCLITLLYTTGIRRAELINLKEKDIDFQKKELKVTGKRNKQRIVPLLLNTLDVIRKYLNVKNEFFAAKPVDDYLFLTKKGKKMYDVLVYRVINSYFSRVSAKHKKSPHVLRHTFATHLLNNGAGLNSIKELLGHTSLAATQVYTHSSIQELKKVYRNAHPRSRNSK